LDEIVAVKDVRDAGGLHLASIVLMGASMCSRTVLVVLAQSLLLAACGGVVTASVGSENPAPGDAGEDGSFGTSCKGPTPLCCPAGCETLPMATCSPRGWTCPANAALLPPGSICDSDCTSDAAPPKDAAMSVCPAVYSVEGTASPADNLGGIDPRLYASGSCNGPTEQYEDIADASVGPNGDAPTDLTVTLQQSAPRSGMFVTVIHQTTPFPFYLTTCLESAGHGTGSLPQAGQPGTMALVNDPNDEVFPQVQLDTNLDGTDLLFDVSPSLHSMFTLNTVTCNFTKN
jgi:hypothetical protein